MASSTGRCRSFDGAEQRSATSPSNPAQAVEERTASWAEWRVNASRRRLRSRPTDPQSCPGPPALALR
jgi:hypothetical protein